MGMVVETTVRIIGAITTATPTTTTSSSATTLTPTKEVISVPTAKKEIFVVPFCKFGARKNRRGEARVSGKGKSCVKILFINPRSRRNYPIHVVAYTENHECYRLWEIIIGDNQYMEK